MTSSYQLIPSERDLASPHIIQVQASAGSGKTYLIAQRFCQLLISQLIPNSEPRNIVAITFTNEAANQMRARILSMLKGIAMGDKTVTSNVEGLFEKGVPGGDLRGLAEKRVEQLLKEYHHFNVKTIDSLLHRLVMTSPLELGISHEEEIIEDESSLLDQSLERLFLKAKEESSLLKDLGGIVDHYLRFERGEAWWPKQSILEKLRALHQKESTLGVPCITEAPEFKELKILENLIRERIKIFLEKVEKNKVEMKKHPRNALEKILTDGPMGLRLHSKPSKTFSYDHPKALFKKKFHEKAHRFVEDWETIRDLLSVYSLKWSLYSPAPYLHCYGRFKETLEERKKALNAILIGDINVLCARLLASLPIYDLTQRLGTQFFHFLLDEFQDTSLIQWKALWPLLDEALSSGGTVFAVGDPKQILYRWRGSEMEVFSEALRGFSSVPHVHSIHPPYNWRSREILVDFVGKAFSQEGIEVILESSGLPRSKWPLVLTPFEHVAQVCSPEKEREEVKEGYVEIHIPHDELNSQEAMRAASHWTLEVLKGLLERFNPGNILILLRKNQDVQEFTRILSEQGIPVCSHLQLDVRRDPGVRALINCLKLVDSPLNPVAVHALKNQYPHLKILEKIQEFTKLSGVLKPYDLASLICQVIGLLDLEPHSQGALFHFLELLHQHEEKEAKDLRQLLKWTQQANEAPFIMPMPKGIDAVKIMTIHKAKGLEAEVVILPMFVVSQEKVNNLMDLAAGDGGVRLINNCSPFRDLSPVLHEAYLEEKAKSLLDELNCAYVALTRARDELYCFCPVPKRKKNLAIHLFEALFKDASQDGGNCIYSFGEKLPLEPPKKTDSPGLLAQERFWKGQGHREAKSTLRFMVKRPVEPLIQMGSDRIQAIHQGEVAHFILSRIGRLEVEKTPSSVHRLLAEVFEKAFGKEKGTISFLEAISRTMLHPDAMPLFWGPDPMKVFNEKEIATKDGNLYRVDRLVILEEQGLILVGEYKTGRDRRREDFEQLQRYMKISRQIYPGYRIEGRLLYLDMEEVERLK